MKRSEIKEKRKKIFILANMQGKKPETTKRWLSRNRKLPEHLFKKKFLKWLKIQQRGGKK
jgi:hypothetical protein